MNKTDNKMYNLGTHNCNHFIVVICSILMGYCSPFLIDLFKMSRDETQKYISANQNGTYKMDVFLWMRLEYIWQRLYSANSSI